MSPTARGQFEAWKRGERLVWEIQLAHERFNIVYRVVVSAAGVRDITWGGDPIPQRWIVAHWLRDIMDWGFEWKADGAVVSQAQYDALKLIAGFDHAWVVASDSA